MAESLRSHIRRLPISAPVRGTAGLLLTGSLKISRQHDVYAGHHGYWTIFHEEGSYGGDRPAWWVRPRRSGQRAGERGALDVDLDLVTGLDGRVVRVLVAEAVHHLAAAPRRDDQADAVAGLAGRPAALGGVAEPQP